jgi:hypothetical protein
VKIIHHHTPVFPSFKTVAKSRQMCQRFSEHVRQYCVSRNQQSRAVRVQSVPSNRSHLSPTLCYRDHYLQNQTQTSCFFDIIINPTSYTASRGQGTSSSGFLPVFIVLDIMLSRVSLLEVDNMTFDHLTKSETIATDFGYTFMEGVSTRPNSMVSVSRNGSFSWMAIPSWTD